MADFYTNVFGWKTQLLGPETGNYVLAATTETDKEGMVKTPGAINGGFFPKMADKTANFPLVVISVDDLDAHMKLVAKAGGKVLGKPVDIPGVGRYVAFRDTEGNRVCMLQPLKH